jgi:type II secretory ATPase GspE/PulE/Tfp pilus assembly ATPase PilB-like protein
MDLGVESYLIAAAVEGVLAQRLVRRICAECREQYRPDTQAVALLAGRPVGELTLQRGRGCAACRDTGYRGRTGIFELLVMSDAVRSALTAGQDLHRLRDIVSQQGMTTLRVDGWRKVQAGITTVEEVLRVVQD